MHQAIENFNRKQLDRADRELDQIKTVIQAPGDIEMNSRKADEMADNLTRPEKIPEKILDKLENLAGIQELTETKSENRVESLSKPAEIEPQPEKVANLPVSPNQPAAVQPAITTETIMAQQMTILTQMMAIMTQNMAQQGQANLQPTQVSMRQPQANSNRIISPRTLKENVNRSLQKVSGLPLLQAGVDTFGLAILAGLKLDGSCEKIFKVKIFGLFLPKIFSSQIFFGKIKPNVLT